MKYGFLFAVLFFSWAWAEEPVCPTSNEAVTTPAPVNLPQLIDKVKALKTKTGETLFSASPTLPDAIAETFDVSKVLTKMEQFYRLLWILAEDMKKQDRTSVSLSAESVQSVLLESKVFTDPKIPSRIRSIDFDLSGKDPKCIVTYQSDTIELPLNQGEGFYLFRNGKCQHAQKLIFDSTFSFQMKKNLGNLMVYDFEGVDLFGDFGNRGIIDVDIQYVSLRSVEFLSGTVNGRVIAYVSREEFRQNKHNPLLELVTRIVPDRSVQPIDW